MGEMQNTLGDFVLRTASTVAMNSERLARVEEQVKGIVSNQQRCRDAQAKAVEELTKSMESVRSEVGEVKETYRKIEATLEDLQQRGEQRFEWRRELLKAAVSLLIAMTVLLGAYWKALPEIRADVQETISATVAEAVEATASR